MIKGVVFDCFGVLYGGSFSILLDMCPAENRQELINLNKENDYGYIGADDYAIGVASLIGRTAEEVKSIFAQKHVRNQRMFEYVKELRIRGYKTALLTNAGRDMPGALFSAQELKGMFDAYLISSQMRLVKPHPGAFMFIAEKLGLATGKCVMVDDTEANIEGADAAGMPGVWFTTADEAIQHIEARLSLCD
jgi:HAD superfamily hydrolase (TIGR01509 family)